MQATTSAFGGNTIALVVLGVIETAITVTVLTNASVPLIGNNRHTLIAFVLIGFAMCSMGMDITQYGWTNPFNILGIVIGIVALVIAVASIFGAQLPLIADERAAILAIAVLMMIKIVVAGVRGVVS